MKKYFTKYIIVDDDLDKIQNGEYYYSPREGKLKCNNKSIFLSHPDKAFEIGFRRMKLFLCTREIIVGDYIRSFNNGDLIKPFKDGVVTSVKCHEGSDEVFLYMVGGTFIGKHLCIRVVGEIMNPEFKENQEFDEITPEMKINLVVN